VRYEYPQGRRVNALVAYRPYDRSPRLEVATAERTWKAEDLVAFLKSLPWSKCPRVVVLDNAGLHTKAARLARRELMASGIYLYFLPAYSPELNEIEPVFRQVKYQEMPVRSYTSRAGLREAVVEGFANYRKKLRPKREKKSRLAA
jgi:transposase